MHKKNSAKLYAVYVVSMGVYFDYLSPTAEFEKARKEQLFAEGRQATGYAETAGKTANVDVEPVHLEGNPADEIVNFAEKNDIELVIMGTLGKAGVQRFLLGSVAEKVVRHSKVPVLVVRDNTERGIKIKEGPSSILIATDGSKTAEHAAALGIKIAQQYGAKVYAVYVINITASEAILIDEAWATEECVACEKTGHRATSSVEEKAKFAGLAAESTILKGDPADRILDFADEHNIDMIVVGSLGKSEIERFALGSVSEKVVRHAKVPVLVVR